MKKIVLGLIILISLIFGIYMVQKNNYVHSEAVFVGTDTLTNVAFKIDGKIDKMTKEAGDKIKKGELLATLETKILNTKLKEIEYKIQSMNDKLSELNIQKTKLSSDLDINQKLIKNDINQTNIKLKSLNYQILANEAKLKKLKYDKDKFYRLYKSKKISFNKYNTIKAEYEYLFNMINSQKENLNNLKIAINSLDDKLKLNKNNYKNINILNSKIQSLKNQTLSLREIKKSLLVKLDDSKLYSPFNGVIAKKFVNSSTVIESGSFIYSIVNPKDIYIKVLLSEKKLSGIKIGDKAVVSLDAYENDIKGSVEKIMPVSASTFSLVPRDIASGEFTKLDQRFIVKIKIPYNPKFKIGMSGEVKIYK